MCFRACACYIPTEKEDTEHHFSVDRSETAVIKEHAISLITSPFFIKYPL